MGDTVQDAREQTLRNIFISPSLGLLYGATAPPGWAPYEIPAGRPRIGLLT